MNGVESGQHYEYVAGGAMIKGGPRERVAASSTPYPPVAIGGILSEEVSAQPRGDLGRAGKAYVRGAVHLPSFKTGMDPRAPEYAVSPGLWLPTSPTPLPMQVGVPVGPYNYMYPQEQGALPQHFPLPGRQLSQLPQQPQFLQPAPQQPQYLWYPYPVLPSPQTAPTFQCPTCRCHTPVPSTPQPIMLIPGPPSVLADQGAESNSTEQAPAHPPRAEERSSVASAGSEVGRKKSICKVLGCGKLNKGGGLCKHHGGGRRCAAEGCDRSSRGAEGLCIKHGGGPRCLYPSCMSSARNSGGFCKKHGGGRRCITADCTKYSMPNSDLCTTHAGLPTPQSEGRVMDELLALAPLPASPPALPLYPGLFPPLLWEDEVAQQGHADPFTAGTTSAQQPLGLSPTLLQPPLEAAHKGNTNTVATASPQQHSTANRGDSKAWS